MKGRYAELSEGNIHLGEGPVRLEEGLVYLGEALGTWRRVFGT